MRVFDQNENDVFRPNERLFTPRTGMLCYVVLFIEHLQNIHFQIGNYGLHAFKRGENPEDVGDYERYMKMLWTAPEILRSPNIPRNGTPKGDIYSYGIILQEIVYRAMPFFMDEMSPKGEAGYVLC